MRPFDIEPNYYEDLLISQNKIKSPKSDFKYFDEENDMGMSNADFMKKTMNDQQFVKSHATIVSASPFRAVIRRNNTEQSELEFNERISDDNDAEEEADQFDRAINDFSQFENNIDNKETYTTGRVYGGVADMDNSNINNKDFLKQYSVPVFQPTNDNGGQRFNGDSINARSERDNYLNQFTHNQQNVRATKTP